jgi:hypothetical protein
MENDWDDKYHSRFLSVSHADILVGLWHFSDVAGLPDDVRS